MFNLSRCFVLTGAMLGVLFTLSNARAAYSERDPPGRVARLNHTQGEVSYSPAGEDDWIDVVRNRPLVRGDRLWTERNARAEVQMGSAAVRLGPNTSFEILNLDDSIAQVQITQGTINLRVRRLYRGQIVEVATPTLAFTVNRAGRYRVDVDAERDETTIVVWEGSGEAYGEDASFPLSTGDTVRFFDADLRDFEMYGLPRIDSFDRYCLDRDRRLDQSLSLRYVGDDVVGYSDLDEYGSWRPLRGYGNVWFPNRVSSNWAPYQDGHWVWQEPWGWTWVDSAPWGFAPSHYGRWVSVSNRWGWVPGPRNVRPIYAPALVAFVGGRHWSASLSLRGSAPIGWFPLAPSEVYVPSYRASRDYFNRVNVNNTVINNTIITNIYNNNYAGGNNNVTQVNYANRSIAGAVTAVPGDVFANARSVRQSALRLDQNVAEMGEVTRVAPIAPSMRSVLGAGGSTNARPEPEAFERQVFARQAPPPDVRSFDARKQLLLQNPGRVPESASDTTAKGQDEPRAHVRVIAGRVEALNAREMQSRRTGEQPTAPGAQPNTLPALDRSIESGEGRRRTSNDRARSEKRDATDEQPPAEPTRRMEREPRAASPQNSEDQRRRQTDQQSRQQQQQQQLGAQQQTEFGRQVELEKQKEQELQRDRQNQKANEDTQQRRNIEQRQAEEAAAQTQRRQPRPERALPPQNDSEQNANEQRARRQRPAPEPQVLPAPLPPSQEAEPPGESKSSKSRRQQREREDEKKPEHEDVRRSNEQ